MPPKKDMPRNDTQEKILNFIKSEVERRGFPPSVREICEAMDIKSTSTVHGHLRRLENRGLLVRDPTKPRALEVVGMNHSGVRIPVVGKVTAGYPITAVENVEDYLTVSPDFFTKDEDNCFALRVSGDSMINAGIFNGDIVVVHKQESADNGTIVVALVNGEEATVKRFFREDSKGRVRLQPENDDFPPMYFDDVMILGRVVGSIRRF